MDEIHFQVVEEKSYGFNLLNGPPIPKWLLHGIWITNIVYWTVKFLSWEMTWFIAAGPSVCAVLGLLYVSRMAYHGLEVEREFHFKLTSKKNWFERW